MFSRVVSTLFNLWTWVPAVQQCLMPLYFSSVWCIAIQSRSSQQSVMPSALTELFTGLRALIRTESRSWVEITWTTARSRQVVFITRQSADQPRTYYVNLLAHPGVSDEMSYCHDDKCPPVHLSVPVWRGLAVFADAWLSGWLAEVSADLRETVAHQRSRRCTIQIHDFTFFYFLWTNHQMSYLSVGHMFAFLLKLAESIILAVFL